MELLARPPCPSRMPSSLLRAQPVGRTLSKCFLGAPRAAPERQHFHCHPAPQSPPSQPKSSHVCFSGVRGAGNLPDHTTPNAVLGFAGPVSGPNPSQVHVPGANGAGSPGIFCFAVSLTARSPLDLAVADARRAGGMRSWEPQAQSGGPIPWKYVYLGPEELETLRKP